MGKRTRLIMYNFYVVYQYTTHWMLLYERYKFKFPLPMLQWLCKAIFCIFFLGVLHLKNVFTYMYNEKPMLCTVIRNWGFISATRLFIHESRGIHISPSVLKRTVTTYFYELLLDLSRPEANYQTFLKFDMSVFHADQNSVKLYDTDLMIFNSIIVEEFLRFWRLVPHNRLFNLVKPIPVVVNCVAVIFVQYMKTWKIKQFTWFELLENIGLL